MRQGCALLDLTVSNKGPFAVLLCEGIGRKPFLSGGSCQGESFGATHLSPETSQQTPQSLLLSGATVSASGLGSPPTGLVTFFNGTTVLGTGYLGNGTTSGGTTQATATFDGSQLAAGPYSVTASYPGDTNYTASNSTAVALI